MPPKRTIKAATGPRRSTRATNAPELFAESALSVVAKAPAGKRKAADENMPAAAKRARGRPSASEGAPTKIAKTKSKTAVAKSSSSTLRGEGRPHKITTGRKTPVSRTTTSTARPSRVTKPTLPTTTSRGRGRPKKTESTTTTAAATKAKAPAARGRGRPKQVTSAAGVEGPEEKMTATPSQGRGRPKKTDTTVATTTRGRGRPKKIETAAEREVEDEQTTATTAGNKGRPKKTPVSRKSPPVNKPAPAASSRKNKSEVASASTTSAPTSRRAPKHGARDDPDSTDLPAPSKAKKSKASTAKATKTINEPPSKELTVFLAGVGESGELGMGTEKKTGMNAKRPRLNKLLGEAGVVQIAPAAMHCVALTHDNHILTWGVNDQGALGRNTDWDGGLKDMDAADDSDSDSQDGDSGLNPREAVPTAIPADSFPPNTTFAYVTASDSATFALTTDGQVYGWGTFRDNNGILGFTKDGQVQTTPIKIHGLSDIVSIVCGNNHVIALNNTGTAYSFGAGQQSQLGRTVSDADRFKALKPHEFGLPNGEITSIHAGSEHSFALGTNGRIWAWGLNNFGQCGIESTSGQDGSVVSKPTLCEPLISGHIVDVRGGNHHSVALTSDGNVLVWGRADGGQLGIDLSTIPESDVARSESTGRIGLVKRPALVTNIPQNQTTYVTTATDHSVAITKDGQAFSWGFSQLYQTGLGTDDDVNIATLIDNTAIRNKKLNWAGCGGQFSVFTCVAGAEGEREAAINGTKATEIKGSSIEGAVVEHTLDSAPTTASAFAHTSPGLLEASPMPTLPPSTPDFSIMAGNSAAFASNHNGSAFTLTPAVETHLQSPAVEALGKAEQAASGARGGMGKTNKSLPASLGFNGVRMGKTIGFDSPADVTMMDQDASLANEGMPAVAAAAYAHMNIEKAKKNLSNHDLFNGSVVSDT